MEGCHVCFGDMEERATSFMLHKNGQYYIVENVPSLVCTQCGETLHMLDVSERLHKMIKDADGETAKVVLLDYNDAEAIALGA